MSLDGISGSLIQMSLADISTPLLIIKYPCLDSTRSPGDVFPAKAFVKQQIFLCSLMTWF